MFSKRLKELREEKKISQAKLSEVLEISQQAIAKWEIEKSSPDPQMLVKIAKYFGVSVDYLLGTTSVKRNIPTHAAHRAEDFRKELPPDKIKEIENFIDFQLKQHRERQRLE